MWKSSYLIGVDQIDQQHKQLIGALDDLLKCINQSDEAGRERCKQTIEFLKEFVVNHFTAEELLQQEIDYPQREAHRKLHEGFRTSLHEIELELMRSDYSAAKVQEVVHMLTRWWLFHILKEDKKMKPYLPKR